MELRGLFIAAAVLLMALWHWASLGHHGQPGPGGGSPTSTALPGGAGEHGRQTPAWCDVRSVIVPGVGYIEILTAIATLALPDYVDEVDVPVVPFVLTSYWSSYYAGRPWYRRHAYWNGYWQSHERFRDAIGDRPLGGPDLVALRSARRAATRSGGKGACRCRGKVACAYRGADAHRRNARRGRKNCARSAREGRERAVQARTMRQNPRMTRESTRASVR